MRVREIVQRRSVGTTVGVADGHVDSVRLVDQTETAVRVYEGGAVGLASAIGSADLDALTRAATDALALGLPHPPGPNRELASDTTHPGERYDANGLAEQVQIVLEGLRERFPTFVFSNKVYAQHEELTLRNDLGVDHRHVQTSTTLALLYKERGSPSIFDGYFALEADAIAPDAMLAHMTRWLEAFRRPVAALEPGAHPVLFRGLDTLAMPFRAGLTARGVATGASRFASRMGQAAFSPRFTLHDTRDAARWRVCPFDVEGSTREVADLPLVHEGVLRQAVASRRDAARFELPATANAAGGLSGLPGTAVGRLQVAPTADRLEDLLDGPAILVEIAAGGDASELGDVAMPAQLAWLVEPDGTPIARVPQLTLTGNLYRIFGDDYLGATRIPAHAFTEEGYLAVRMRVEGQG